MSRALVIFLCLGMMTAVAVFVFMSAHMPSPPNKEVTQVGDPNVGISGKSTHRVQAGSDRLNDRKTRLGSVRSNLGIGIVRSRLLMNRGVIDGGLGEYLRAEASKQKSELSAYCGDLIFDVNSTEGERRELATKILFAFKADPELVAEIATSSEVDLKASALMINSLTFSLLESSDVASLTKVYGRLSPGELRKGLSVSVSLAFAKNHGLDAAFGWIDSITEYNEKVESLISLAKLNSSAGDDWQNALEVKASTVIARSDQVARARFDSANKVLFE
jgi:hypothetical protein